MRATLSLDVEFDPDLTDAESLAAAADTLLQTALSTPGILDDYGTPRFGDFVVANTGPQFICRAQPAQHTPVEELDDICPDHPDGHEPDWTRVEVELDGEAYVDVACKHCGRFGCVGSVTALARNISW